MESPVTKHDYLDLISKKKKKKKNVFMTSCFPVKFNLFAGSRKRAELWRTLWHFRLYLFLHKGRQFPNFVMKGGGVKELEWFFSTLSQLGIELYLSFYWYFLHTYLYL